MICFGGENSKSCTKNKTLAMKQNLRGNNPETITNYIITELWRGYNGRKYFKSIEEIFCEIKKHLVIKYIKKIEKY